jgi:hypothetical protein
MRLITVRYNTLSPAFYTVIIAHKHSSYSKEPSQKEGMYSTVPVKSGSAKKPDFRQPFLWKEFMRIFQKMAVESPAF